MKMIGNCMIAGVGAFLPSQKILSDDLMHESGCQKFGTPIDYISRRIGIEERRSADDFMEPSDLASEAVDVAMKNAGIDASEVDLIIYCGIDKDYEEPSTAHNVWKKTGTFNATVFDLQNACHGFFDAICVANMAISCSSVETVLICSGEKQTKHLKTSLPRLRALKDKDSFKKSLGVLTVGDSGGAMVIRRSEGANGLQWLQTHTDGSLSNLCYFKYSDQGIDGQMLMREISVAITRLHKSIIDSTYSSLKWTPDDVDRIYCHQVGAKPHKALVSVAKKPLDVAPVTYKNLANLTSNSIPVNMFLNPPHSGEKLLLMGTGSGLTVGQAGYIQ